MSMVGSRTGGDLSHGYRWLPSHQAAFEEWHSGKGPWGCSQGLHRTRKSRSRGWKGVTGQPGNSYFSRTCLLTCFLQASIWVKWDGHHSFRVIQGWTGSSEASVTCGLQDIPQTTQARKLRCVVDTAVGLIKACTDRSIVRLVLCKDDSAAVIQASWLKFIRGPPCRPDLVIQEVQQCMYRLREQGQSHGGRAPLSSCLMTAVGVIIPGCLIKKKKKCPRNVGYYYVQFRNTIHSFIWYWMNIYWVASMCIWG